MTNQTFREETIRGLSDKQLIALLLSNDGKNYFPTERASDMLLKCRNNLHLFYNLSLEDMVSSLEVRFTEALRIKLAFELARRQQVSEILSRPKISKSKDIHQLFQHLSEKKFEEFWIVILDNGNTVITTEKISEGGITSTLVDIRRIMNSVVKVLGVALILIHNHPSFRPPKPSQPDIAFTKKITDAAQLFDVKVVDHLIISSSGYYSFADEGIL